jgi:hypothetical protein
MDKTWGQRQLDSIVLLNPQVSWPATAGHPVLAALSFQEQQYFSSLVSEQHHLDGPLLRAMTP